MSNHFPRTLRAMRNDGYRQWGWAVLVVALLLLLWGLWFFGARVHVYAVSDSARLEVETETHPVDAPVGGRLDSVLVRLDESVIEGQALFELAADEQRHLLEEEEARAAGLEARSGALEREVLTEEEGIASWLGSARKQAEEAAARRREADAAARLASEEVSRLVALLEQGLVSEMDVVRARSEAERTRSQAEALESSAARLTWDAGAEESDRRGRLEELKGELAQIERDIAAADAVVARLRDELERRRIRAPIAGKVGEISSLRAGSHVAPGTRLAAIVPEGRMRVVADFAPAVAVGRIRSGQPARLKLTAFPSTEFGSIRATVERVASETRGDAIRVELTIAPDPSSRIPLEHGLAGVLEVAVEEVSPASLVLRAAGKLLDEPAPDTAGK